MKISDLVYFDKERYFQGAIQADWFYDQSKMHSIASSYVFHGPKYYGVSKSDVSLGQHRLIDTASFVKNLTKKVYSPEPDNYFLMTIAGYGTGKSHLAVSLGGLYAGDSMLRHRITENIRMADKACGDYVEDTNTKKNLVLVLNGMNNFNLDTQVLMQIRVILAQNGIGDEILQPLTKSYDIAAHFVENMFPLSQVQFEQAAKKVGISLKGQSLKSFLLTKMQTDSLALKIINIVYTALNGDGLHWDRGLSAGDILTAVNKSLCGPEKPFNKILILFDEFGRYIEYAASQPTIAGEAALQQIFEAVQSAKGNILFVGFIQSELDAYLSRIEKTSNIIRYVGRYKASENLFLSSNFETILANLIQKKDPVAHEEIIEHSLTFYPKRYAKLHSALNRWTEKYTSKSVWTNEQMFQSVIIKGAYPLHPITVWLLSNMHQWMQQRSALTFVSEMLDSKMKTKVEGAYLPYIYPVDIINSSIYKELLNAEEKGLVQSQHCLLYRDILVKVGSKLSSDELLALQGILVLNIGKFSFREEADVLYALRQCTDLSEDNLALALKELERSHGVIAYDNRAHIFDLLAEASGFNEFKRLFNRYRTGVSSSISDCDEIILRDLRVVRPIETTFAQQNDICSKEWCFAQKLVDSSIITQDVLSSAIFRLESINNGEEPRGLFYFAYCAKDAQNEILRLSHLYRTLKLHQYPIHILFLDDHDADILTALTHRAAIFKFSSAERQRFDRHVTGQLKKQAKSIIEIFKQLSSQRNYISENGLQHQDKRLNVLCSDTFATLYPQVTPFMFDGLEKKSIAQAKKYYANICIKLIDRTLMNVQSYQSLTLEEKNRVKAALSIYAPTSWKVFDNNCRLSLPGNPILLECYNCVTESLSESEALPVQNLFGKYTIAPYGMNDYAWTLFIFYFIAMQGQEVLAFFGQEKLSPAHLSNYIFKNGRLNKSEVLKIRLQKNTNANVDLVDKKCQEILRKTVVEQCEAFAHQLTDIVTQEGLTSQNQCIYAEAKIYLEEGLRLKKEIYSRLDKVSEIVDATSKKFVAHQLIKAFEYLIPCNGKIEPTLPFVYSESYQEAQSKLTKQVQTFLEKYYLASLKRLHCDITQISQLKLRYKAITTILQKEGYTEYVQATEQRIAEVIAEAEADKIYKSTIVELERDITLYGNSSSYSGDQCDEAEEKFQRWLAFFTQATMLPSSKKDPILKNIEQILTSIAKRKLAIDAEVEDLMQEAISAQSIKSLRNTQQSLISISKSLSKKDISKVSDFLYSVGVAIACIEEAPEGLDDLRAIIRYSNASNMGQLKPFVKRELSKQEKILANKETIWLNSYGSLDSESIAYMSAIACSKWLDGSRIYPNYLSKAIQDKHKMLIPLVEKRLHDSRIQGVVALFKGLSADEKESCLNQLKRL